MKKMTMKQYEATPQDKKMDKKEAKLGIKEGSARDKAMDRIGLAALRGHNSGMTKRK